MKKFHFIPSFRSRQQPRGEELKHLPALGINISSCSRINADKSHLQKLYSNILHMYRGCKITLIKDIDSDERVLTHYFFFSCKCFGITYFVCGRKGGSGKILTLPNSHATLDVGSAPQESQYCTRSTFAVISFTPSANGRGLYVPS